jgi:two-component system response regulator
MIDCKKKCILLVEDNPDDIELTKRAFRKQKIMNDMIVAHDGEEALDFLFCRNEYAQKNPNELPTIILLDLNLPKISGLEVLREIRSNPITALLPVVVLTSSKEEQDLMSSYKLGANSYIRKPVDFEQFLSAVSALGLYWLLLNQEPPTVSR